MFIHFFRNKGFLFPHGLFTKRSHLHEWYDIRVFLGRQANGTLRMVPNLRRCFRCFWTPEAHATLPWRWRCALPSWDHPVVVAESFGKPTNSSRLVLFQNLPKLSPNRSLAYKHWWCRIDSRISKFKRHAMLTILDFPPMVTIHVATATVHLVGSIHLLFARRNHSPVKRSWLGWWGVRRLSVSEGFGCTKIQVYAASSSIHETKLCSQFACSEIHLYIYIYKTSFSPSEHTPAMAPQCVSHMVKSVKSPPTNGLLRVAHSA